MSESRIGGEAPVAPPAEQGHPAPQKARRKPAQRGKAGGRTLHRTVWLTEAENSLLETKAAEAGLSAASYLRASALGDAGIRARRAPTLEKQLLGVGIAELNRVGNNVNQIARALNIGKERDPAELAFTMEQLRGVLDIMRRAFFV